VVERIQSYSQHGKLVLYALTRLHERGDTQVRTREVVETYRSVAHWGE
jgi:cell division control protein 6